ncbi:MAG: molybdopterin-guanine dinucleotide biosynthesis protein B [Pseudomonadales bacterium]|jgi:molybdopterin-guanine dinucleotide biosynthesis protein MobB|nr:molybdopterin-guanine dinucleotide biosynthesis protein B [Pseudomonadales bacterium]MCP5214782.1 molybdopterin-guanine dinucleotide biosynthesis protein B [Pseudomonadales bacterium]
MKKVFGITGWKNSGKTTLVVKLVEHFSAQGLKVATIKHAHHDFDIDIPNTDSYKHRKAGAAEVIVTSDLRWALIHELEGKREPSLTELIEKLSDDVDLILVEGYKIEQHPKIQVIRTENEKSNQPMPDNIPSIVAFAADQKLDPLKYGRDCPLLDLNDTSQIADFILRYLESA